MSLLKFEHHGSQRVNAHVRVAADERDHALRLAVKQKARQRHRIAADVHHAAAARQIGAVADIVRIAPHVGKKRLNRLQIADFPVMHILFCQNPLRVRAIHERFHQQDAFFAAAFDQFLRVLRVDAERLFA